MPSPEQKYFPTIAARKVISMAHRVGEFLSSKKKVDKVGVATTASLPLLVKVTAETPVPDSSIAKKENPVVENTLVKKELKTRKRHWAKSQEKTMYVLFALTEDGAKFEYPFRPEIVKRVYANRLNSLSGTPDYRQEYIRCNEGFSRGREKAIVMVEKVIANPNDETLPPEALDFWNWLRAQPAYANATVDDLISVARRPITLRELQNKIILSVDLQSKFPSPAPLPPVISVVNNPQAVAEESLDKPPALAIAQIAALGRILGEPIYKSLLRKYGITIDPSEIEHEIHTILATCRQDIAGLYTQTFLKNSFPLLVQYLKEFAGGDRKAFLDSNSEQAQTLLEMIPAKITVDNLGHLMDEIEAIINS